MKVKDEWVIAAMTEDKVVADLLLRMKASRFSSPPESLPSKVIPLRWGLRKPRSRIASSPFRLDAVPKRNKEADSVRCSPTTPLSWSGGSSPSAATVDGFEDSSLSSSHGVPRSKGITTNESTATTITATKRKRLRQNKTIVELKEKERFLLRERIHLKKELATLRASFEQQCASNDNLKRTKLNLNLHCSNSYNAISNGFEETTFRQSQLVVRPPTPPTLRMHVKHGHESRPDSFEACKLNSTDNGVFLLPDLNMMPSDHNFGSET